MKRIIAMVFFERGSHGFEEDYDENIPIEKYLKLFENRTNADSDAKYAKTFYLEITQHNEDGTEVVDENGNRVTKQIYINKDMANAIFNQ